MSKAVIIRSAETVRFGMPSFERKRPADIRASVPGQRASAEETERDAYEKGFAAGEKAGMEMGEQKAAVLLKRIEKIISEIEEYRKMLLSELEPQVLELSSDIAKKIVLEELSVKPEVMINIVRESIRRLERTGPITIKLNPSVQELFMRLKPELLEVHPDIIFDIDPSVPPMGQVIIGASEEIVTDTGIQVDNIIEDIGGGSGGR